MKKREPVLTPKDVARIKVMMQYEVKKPLMDEIKKLRNDLKLKQ